MSQFELAKLRRTQPHVLDALVMHRRALHQVGFEQGRAPTQQLQQRIITYALARTQLDAPQHGTVPSQVTHALAGNAKATGQIGPLEAWARRGEHLQRMVRNARHATKVNGHKLRRILQHSRQRFLGDLRAT